MPTLPTSQLSKIRPHLPRLRFGTMSLSGMNGPIDSDEERFKVFDRAYQLGQTFRDTANAYVSQ